MTLQNSQVDGQKVLSTVRLLRTLSYNGTYIYSQSNTKGQCVKASGSAKWIMTDCADTLGKGFVCQMDQNVEEVGKKSVYLMLFKIVFCPMCPNQIYPCYQGHIKD